MSPPRPRRLAAAGLALALALVAACGDGDDDDDAGAVSDDACDAFVALSGVLAADPAEAAVGVETFRATAPEGLDDEVAVMVATYEGLLEGGDPAALGEPGFVEASGAVADAYFAGCDTNDELDVEGVDYAFDGLPEEISAGRVAVAFSNAAESGEAHEMVLFRRLAGTDESPDELFGLSDEELFSKVAMAGAVFVDEPGGEAFAMYDLDAGDYIVVCSLPIGGDEGGAPHFTEGMVAELTVS